MNSRPFVIFDRDGTLIVERHYLSDPEQVELLPGVPQALARLASLNIGMIVITNQSGVGRGFFDLLRLEQIHKRLLQLLSVAGVSIDGLYFCPHIPENGCSCRKPKPGLIEQAGQDWNFDPHTSFVIGDKPCDIQLGQTVGATTILVQTGYGVESAQNPTIKPHYIADDLTVAVDFIIQQLLQEGRLRDDHAIH